MNVMVPPQNSTGGFDTYVCIPISINCPIRYEDYSVTQTPRIDILTSAYYFRDKAGVNNFLNERPDLTPILMSAHIAIMSYFDDGILYLDTYPDPEEPTFVILALRIATSRRYPEIRRRLNAFRREWWIPKVDSHLRENVAIDVEPI